MHPAVPPGAAAAFQRIAARTLFSDERSPGTRSASPAEWDKGRVCREWKLGAGTPRGGHDVLQDAGGAPQTLKCDHRVDGVDPLGSLGGIAIRTVEVHRAKIFEKLRVKNAAEMWGRR